MRSLAVCTFPRGFLLALRFPSPAASRLRPRHPSLFAFAAVPSTSPCYSTWNSRPPLQASSQEMATGDVPSVPNTAAAAGQDDSFPPKWLRWLFGSVLTIFSMWMRPWTSFMRIKNEVEEVVEAVEATVEVVEKVATIAEEMAQDVAKKLPEGKLKDAMEVIGGVAEDVVEKTKLAEDILHKVEEVNEEVEKLLGMKKEGQSE